MHSNAAKVSKRVGAAIFSKGALIAFGYNVYDWTHPDAHRTDSYTRNLHAEHKALLKRQYYSNNGMVLYTYRETVDGTPACSKPCNNCEALIREAGISVVRYIDQNGQMAEIAL